MQTVLHDTAQNLLGKTTRKHQNWFDQNDDVISEAISHKRAALDASRTQPTCLMKKRTYQEAKAEVQNLTRTLKDAFWRNEAADIKEIAEKNNSRAFFAATKAIYSPSTGGPTPLKSEGGTLLKNPTESDDRLQEHWRSC